MSIQRYKYAVLPGGMDPHPDGDWVTYADHIAEVQELRNQLLKHHHLYYRQLWEDAVNACIEAAEEVLSRTMNADHGDYLLVSKHHPADLIAALREVQP